MHRQTGGIGCHHHDNSPDSLLPRSFTVRSAMPVTTAYDSTVRLRGTQLRNQPHAPPYVTLEGAEQISRTAFGHVSAKFSIRVRKAAGQYRSDVPTGNQGIGVARFCPCSRPLAQEVGPGRFIPRCRGRPHTGEAQARRNLAWAFAVILRRLSSRSGYEPAGSIGALLDSVRCM